MAEFKVDGLAELNSKLLELEDAARGRALREAVREPMAYVQGRASANLSKISPGKTPIHRTYLGRWVTAGFAQRSLRMITRLDKLKTVARAVLGVRKEAFYVLQFWELGTSKLPRTPWLMPAFYQSKDTVVRQMGEIMRERFERIAKKRSRGSRR